MANMIPTHRILRGTFWSVVYVILILWAAKFLWETITDVTKVRWKDMRINHRIKKARTIEANFGVYDNGTTPPWGNP